MDPSVRALARQIASRLSLRRARRDVTRRRGIGDLVSAPYRGGSDEIDLDRTIEVLAEHPVPDDDDIVVRERMRTTRSVVLLVDVSGSMRGERVKTAAATVGAVSSELRSDALAVIAFWSDAAILLRLGATVKPMELLDEILRLPAQGLTNVAFPWSLPISSWRGFPLAMRGCCCSRTACTTPGPIRGRSRRVCLDWTCCWMPRARRTSNWAANSRPRGAACAA
ncbi:VWA domain-containing protein [Microbacterium schleiferi]|uniref:VWA domain-containing protein n=1 Tax=Microbacterium schleiferi TaxID=69362 RepID=UPI001E4ED237|nr:VWA domain-containing protein [Microbacterium schleiferi]